MKYIHHTRLIHIKSYTKASTQNYILYYKKWIIIYKHIQSIQIPIKWNILSNNFTFLVVFYTFYGCDKTNFFPNWMFRHKTKSNIHILEAHIKIHIYCLFAYCMFVNKSEKDYRNKRIAQLRIQYDKSMYSWAENRILRPSFCFRIQKSFFHIYFQQSTTASSHMQKFSLQHLQVKC